MSIVPMDGQNKDKKRGRDRNGKRGTRTSLIAAKRGKELLAPVLFKGSTNALWFNQWLEKHLIPELKPNSTLILDNAATNFVRPRAKLWTQQMLCIVKMMCFVLPNKLVIKFCFYHRTHLTLIASNKTLPSSKKDVFIPLLVLP